MLRWGRRCDRFAPGTLSGRGVAIDSPLIFEISEIPVIRGRENKNWGGGCISLCKASLGSMHIIEGKKKRQTASVRLEERRTRIFPRKRQRERAREQKAE